MKKKWFKHSIRGRYPLTPEGINAIRLGLIKEGADPNGVMTVGIGWVGSTYGGGHYATTFEMPAPETAAERKARLDKATAKINALAEAAGITVKVTT